MMPFLMRRAHAVELRPPPFGIVAMSLSRTPIVTIVLASAATAAYVAGWGDVLQLSHAGLGAGHAWTLWTSHLAHWSSSHLAWDVLALIVLGVLIERRSRQRMLVALALSAPLIGVGFAMLHPGLSGYRGLSGVDSALFVLLGVTMLGDAWRGECAVPAWAVAAVLAGFVAKVIYELAMHDTLFVAASPDQFVPVPLAHVLGGVTGLAVACWPRRGFRRRNESTRLQLTHTTEHPSCCTARS